jgi:VWFA-related protein
MRLAVSTLVSVLLTGTSTVLTGAAEGTPEAPFRAGQQRQSTDIHYDPSSGTVTLKLLVCDSKGNVISDLHRQNFMVYENGARLNKVTVAVEHAPATVGLLLEHGGRHPALSRDLTDKIAEASHQLVDTLGRQDTAAVWTYADTVQQLAGFAQNPQTLDPVLMRLQPPEVSETNLYDALIDAERRMGSVTGRKAIVLISSGIDTCSKATADDVVDAARKSRTPIYIVNLATVVRDLAILRAISHLAIDWKAAEERLEKIAQASGGRQYFLDNVFDSAAIYDDMIDSLKVRYVITYRVPPRGPSDVPRTIQVKLNGVGGATGTGASIATATYVPQQTTARNSR